MTVNDLWAPGALLLSWLCFMACLTSDLCRQMGERNFYEVSLEIINLLNPHCKHISACRWVGIVEREVSCSCVYLNADGFFRKRLSSLWLVSMGVNLLGSSLKSEHLGFQVPGLGAGMFSAAGVWLTLVMLPFDGKQFLAVHLISMMHSDEPQMSKTSVDEKYIPFLL